MVWLKLQLTLKQIKSDSKKHSIWLKITRNTSCQKSIWSTLCTWKMKTGLKKPRKSSSRPTSHKKPLICTSTSKTGTLLFKLRGSTTQSQWTKSFWTRPDSSWTVVTSARLNSALSTQKSQSKLSTCTSKLKCTVRHCELQISTHHTLSTKSTKTILEDLKRANSLEMRSSKAPNNGSMGETTKKQSAGTWRSPSIISKMKISSKRFGTIASTSPWIMQKTVSTKLPIFLGNAF